MEGDRGCLGMTIGTVHGAASSQHGAIFTVVVQTILENDER